jgi:glycosyltransferase involved in cell wall biosynthesis
MTRPLRIAYFSPLPPTPSGIADYSRELIPPLSGLVDLTLFAADPARVGPDLAQRFPVEALAAYPARRWAFDLALYHMGNSPFHAQIYRMALRYPGVVVLHEVVLRDFAAYMTVARGDQAAHAREMGYELGWAGYNAAWLARLGREPAALKEVRFSRRLIDRCLGVIVHSRSAAGMVQALNPERRLAVIDQLVVRREAPSLRGLLPVSDETTVFAALGEINANKQMDLTLDAFARLRQEGQDVFFLIVGAANANVNLPRMIRQRGLDDRVLWTGRVGPLEEFVGWTAAADVVINLRYPSLGETSNAAVRALAAGKPLIVYDQGWSRELPAELCRQVPPLDVEALYRAMEAMVRRPEERRAMGRAAAGYAADQLNPERIAGEYKRFIGEVAAAIRNPAAGA